MSLRARIVKASCAGLKEVVSAQGRGAAWAPGAHIMGRRGHNALWVGRAAMHYV